MRRVLTHLHLSHFRSHRRLALDLDGRIAVFFGPNGAGKTNLIEAVSLLSPGRGMRRATAEDLARRPEGVGWRVRATLTAADAAHEIELRAEPGQPRTTKIDDRVVPQTALGRMLRVLWLVPSMDRLWLEAAEGRRRFVDRIALSFAPSHADAALAYEKAMRERNRLLRDAVGDPRWFAALEDRMAETGAEIAQGRQTALARIAAAQAGAVTAFPAARLALTGPDGAPPAMDAEALREAFAAGRGADFRAGRTLAGPHRADLAATYAAKDMPAEACSTGEQKALLISIVLANARALAEDTGAPPILLLDEIAAHLDADRRAALYDEIDRLGAQAFLTGTDRALFDALGARAEMFELTEAEGASRVCPA